MFIKINEMRVYVYNNEHYKLFEDNLIANFLRTIHNDY